MTHSLLIVIGNLGRDPELRYTPEGTAVASFSVATTRTWKKGDETQKETTWYRVSVFGKQAENCNQYLHKGSKVYLEGRLNPDPATGGPRLYNKQDGSPAASYEVVANTVKFLSTNGEKQEQAEF